LDPARQASLINAILEDAAEHGLSAVSMKRIACGSKISVGSLYQYFGDRERLLKFTVELCKGYTQGVFEAALPWLQDMPLLDALVAYVEGGCDWMTQQRSLMKLFVRAAYGGDSELAECLVRPLAASMRGLLMHLLKCAAARGELRAEANLDAAVSILHVLTVALGDARLIPSLDAYLQLHSRTEAQESDVRALIAVALNGIKV
jgi:AcrR family transcriptional regulator